jgi:hypothetical protein
MTVNAASIGPFPERQPTRRRVIGYVHARNPLQRAYMVKSIRDFSDDECYELVEVIEDTCVQHTAVECPDFLKLIEYLTRERVDLVMPGTDHLAIDDVVRSLRLDRIDATTRQVWIVPNEHTNFRETGA